VGGAAAVLRRVRKAECGYASPVDLEEKAIEDLPQRCEECGAKLTPAEIEAAMEAGGPALCSTHAAEDEPGLAVDEAAFPGEG
jgi:hypothetical protein